MCWDYLDSVTNLGAYCGEVFPLPRLKGKSLKAWLNPLFSEFNISFAKSKLNSNLLDGDKSVEDKYFDKLASVSAGVSVVAVQAFLHSLGYKTSEQIAKDRNAHDNSRQNLLAEGRLEKIIPEGLKQKADELKSSAKAAMRDDRESGRTKTETNENNKILLVENPELPKLPNLSSEDHYILYSLLLHGDISLSALTETLGDEEYKVRAQVQMLRRAGIVEERNQILQVNPIYYPKLKQELASNNFVIDKID